MYSFFSENVFYIKLIIFILQPHWYVNAIFNLRNVALDERFYHEFFVKPVRLQKNVNFTSVSVYVEFSKPRTPPYNPDNITSPSDITIALIIADYRVRAKLSRGKTARGLLGRIPAIIVRRMITGVYFVFDRNPTASFSRSASTIFVSRYQG